MIRSIVERTGAKIDVSDDGAFRSRKAVKQIRLCRSSGI